MLISRLLARCAVGAPADLPEAHMAAA